MRTSYPEHHGRWLPIPMWILMAAMLLSIALAAIVMQQGRASSSRTTSSVPL